MKEKPSKGYIRRLALQYRKAQERVLPIAEGLLMSNMDFL